MKLHKKILFQHNIKPISVFLSSKDQLKLKNWEATDVSRVDSAQVCSKLPNGESSHRLRLDCRWRWRGTSIRKSSIDLSRRAAAPCLVHSCLISCLLKPKGCVSCQEFFSLFYEYELHNDFVVFGHMFWYQVVALKIVNLVFA